MNYFTICLRNVIYLCLCSKVESSNWVNGEDSIDVDVSVSSDKSLITKKKNKLKTNNNNTQIVTTKKGKKRSLDDSDDAIEVSPKKLKKRNLDESDTKENDKLSDKKTSKKKMNVNMKIMNFDEANL